MRWSLMSSKMMVGLRRQGNGDKVARGFNKGE